MAGAYGITMIQASLDNELRYLDRLKSITRAQIQAAAQKYLSTTAYALDRVRAPEGAMIRRTLVLVAVLSLWLPRQRAGRDGRRHAGASLPTASPCIVRENPAAPVVGLSLLVKMGTRNETPDNAGISNMLQLMMVRGTEKMTGEQIAATADAWAAASTPTATSTTRRSPPPRSRATGRPMLEMVADVALRPTMPDGTVTAVRDFLVRQIRNRGEKPYDVASDQTRIALFGPRHPYAWDPLGRSEAVQQLNRDALVAYYRRQYVPCADGAGGERRREERRGDAAGAAALRRHARGHGGAADPAGAAAPWPPPARCSRCRARRRRSSWPRWRRRSPTPDYPALKVMSAILGGGMASRFFSELRDQQALAYATAALYPARIDTSSFVAILGTGPDNAGQGRGGAEGRSSAASRPSPRRSRKSPSRGPTSWARQAMDRRTNARQAWYLAAAELAGLGHDYFDTYAAAVQEGDGRRRHASCQAISGRGTNRHRSAELGAGRSASRWQQEERPWLNGARRFDRLRA